MDCATGSINDEMGAIFLGKCKSIIDLTGATLTVIVGDAAVTSVTEVGRADEMKKVKFIGGGGTDFRPLLEEAAKHRPVHCVYLTDLCGRFPDRPPKFPVLWAVPAEFKDMQIPFGKKLILK